MRLLSIFNKETCFLLCVSDIYSKYAWVFPLKVKESIKLLLLFKKKLKESNRKRSKIWVDKGCEFYKTSMKSCLQNNHKEIYSIHHKEKLVIPGRSIRTL